MSVLDLLDKTKVSSGLKGAQAPTTSFFDVVGASFTETKDNFLSVSESALVSELTGERDANYKKTTGNDLYNEAFKLLDDPESAINQRTGTIDKKNKDLLEAVDRVLENAQQSQLGPFMNTEKIQASAQETARRSADTANRVRQGADSFDATAGSLVGGFGAAFMDPVNLATIPFGASGSMGLLKTIAMEAGVNMGAEVALQPSVAEWQEKVGNKYGFPEMAQNVAIAGLFGAAIPLGIKGVEGATTLAAKAPSAVKSAPEFFSGLKERLRKTGDYEAAEAAEYMERSSHIEDSNVARLNTDVDYKAHKASTDEVNLAAKEGRPINPNKIEVTEAEIKGMKAENKLSDNMDSTIAKYTEDLPEVKPLKKLPDSVEKELDEVFNLGKNKDINVVREKEINDLLNSDSVVAEQKLSFDQFVESRVNSGESLSVTLDDGTVRQVKDLQAEFKADDDFINAIKTCGV